MQPIKALSIRQPWAWAIVTLGKDIENRSWNTAYRGPLLIHAGAGLKRADADDFLATIDGDPVLRARLDAAGGFDAGALRAQCGGIVGAVEMIGCVQRAASPWFFGKYGFLFANARALPFQPCKGARGFFTPDPERDRELREAAGIPDRFQTPDLFSPRLVQV